MTDTSFPNEQAQAPSEVFDADSLVVSYERSPLDVLRLILFATTALFVVIVTRYLRDGVDGLEENLTSLLAFDAHGLRLALDLLLLVTVVIATLVTLLVPLVTKRWRLFGYVLAANLLTSLTMSGVNEWVGDLDPESGDAAGTGFEELAVDVSTGVTTTAQLVAAFIVLSPFVGRRWRRMGAALIAAVVVLRLLVAGGQSTHALIVLSVGATVGSAVLLAFGRPTTRPRPSSIVNALRLSGLPVTEIQPAAVDARGSIPWFATCDDGSQLFVKVLGADQRAAALLFQFYRLLRLRNVGDERPFSSLRRTVEHEALVLSLIHISEPTRLKTRSRMPSSA